MEHLNPISHLILFSHNELAELWHAYYELDRIITTAEETHRLYIIDDEIRSGAHFKMKDIEAEMRRRETCYKVTFRLNREDGTFVVWED